MEGLSLEASPDNLIGDQWQRGAGPPLDSIDPAIGDVFWKGHYADKTQVNAAVAAARSMVPRWRKTSLREREKILKKFAEELRVQGEALARLISLEVGKPLWESQTEVDSMVAKIPISIDAYHERCAEVEHPGGSGTSRTRFKPHGAVAVFGPFNFPGHIPNGHIVPALLAGNTVVFKPSEQTPAVSQWIAEAWMRAGLPAGVLNLVQGGAAAGEHLAGHPGIDGVFFTGSHRTGMALHRAFAEHPEKILALEMGGNNPLVVWETNEVDAAAKLTVLSAYLSAGQRCTCARRLIIPTGPEGDAILEALTNLLGSLVVDRFTAEPTPFMGPVISVDAAVNVLKAQKKLSASGGTILTEARHLHESSGLVSPGLIDVTAIEDREDEEIFGPLLQVIRVETFEEALIEANATRFGLAAGLISRHRELYEEFYDTIRAGIVNWNQQLTGASSRSPFGGIGKSGNHRASGYFAADYCSYPIGSVEQESASLPSVLPPGIEPQ